MEKIDERIKSSKQKLGEKIPCSIEILTPVHIGSGVKLAEGIDFIKNNNSVHIVPQSELMKHLENDPEEMNRFTKGNYKLNSLKRIPEGKRYNISIGRTTEINEFERNGNGKPYIPGSSIKGAIRTAILAKLFSTLSQEVKDNVLNLSKDSRKGESWASEPILNEIFGADSNYNLMRALLFFDSDSFEQLDLQKLHLLSLKSDLEYGWKKMGKDRNTQRPFPLQDNPKSATSIYVEALPIGSIGYFTMSINEFLLNDAIAKSELKFKEDSVATLRSILNTINSYSIQKLEKEREFFNKLTNPKKLDSVIKEIDNLINRISNLSQDEFILRLSWGSGWKGMTGDYLDEHWINIFRKKYQLGKRDFPIFPKTRRIVFEDDEPKYLTGWVKVKLFEHVKLSNDANKNEDSGVENDWVAKLSSAFKVTIVKK